MLILFLPVFYLGASLSFDGFLVLVAIYTLTIVVFFYTVYYSKLLRFRVIETEPKMKI